MACGSMCENLSKGADSYVLHWSHDGDSLRWNMGSWTHWLQALAPVLTAIHSPADPMELAGNTGKQNHHLSQYHTNRQGQGHHEAGGQVETVGLLLKGPLPPKQQAMEGGNEQGNVAQSGLEQRQRDVWWCAHVTTAVNVQQSHPSISDTQLLVHCNIPMWQTSPCVTKTQCSLFLLFT